MEPHSQSSVALPVAFVEEGLAARWGRRAVSIPLYVLLTAVVCASLPAVLPLVAGIDVLFRRRFASARAILMLALYLVCETTGIAATAALAVARLLGIERERELSLQYALQRLWARSLFAGVRRIFSLRFECEGEDQIGDSPLLVFIRHASLADTLLPANLIALRHGYRLLYVLKRELLWDPCLDLVGNRLPNVFVRRSAADSTREIDAIRRLAEGLGPRQGVLIYPEGSRFSAAKRERALTRLAERRQVERVERLAHTRHVLPPHLGGPLALLESAPRADVLFVAHCGFENAATLGDICSGALIGRTVRVCFWRVRRADIPSTRSERVAWIDAEWLKIDDWIARQP